MNESNTTGATWEEACREWLRWTEHDRKRKRSTVRDYRLTIDANLIPDLGADRKLETIQRSRLEEYRDSLLREGRLSPRTINKRMTIIHGVFSRAMRVWGQRTNPAADIERVPERRSGDLDVFRPDEIRHLAATAQSEQDAALYVTAAFTELRFGELAALRWTDIDWQRDLIHVRRALAAGAIETPKSGKVRSVPLVAAVATALAKLGQRALWIGEGDFVFVSPTGKHIDYSATVKAYKRALHRAGLRTIKFHGLRHSFGTIAVQAFPLSDVQAWMGHADIQTTMRYVHYAEARGSEAARQTAGGRELGPKLGPKRRRQSVGGRRP